MHILSLAGPVLLLCSLAGCSELPENDASIESKFDADAAHSGFNQVGHSPAVSEPLDSSDNLITHSNAAQTTMSLAETYPRFKDFPLDILSRIINFFAPIRSLSPVHQQVVEVLAVVVALNDLFPDMNYISEIDFNEALSFAPYLSEIDFLAQYPKMLYELLLNGRFPVGTLGLSWLLVLSKHTRIRDRWHRIYNYMGRLTDVQARRSGLMNWLDRWAQNPRLVRNRFYYESIRFGFDSEILDKLSKVIGPDSDLCCGLLHFPAGLDTPIIDMISTCTFLHIYSALVQNPAAVTDCDVSRMVLNQSKAFVASLQFSPHEREMIETLFTIKFGDLDTISRINPIALNAMLSMPGKEALLLVFHIWARPDIPDIVWQTMGVGVGADAGRVNFVSQLVLNPEALIENKTSLQSLVHEDFVQILTTPRYLPKSPKLDHVRKQLRSKILSILVIDEFSSTKSAEALMTMLGYFIRDNDFEIVSHFINLFLSKPEPYNVPSRVYFKWIMRVMRYMPQVFTPEHFAFIIERYFRLILKWDKWSAILRNAINSDALSNIQQMLSVCGIGPYKIFTSLHLHEISPHGIGKLILSFGFTKDQIREALCSLTQNPLYQHGLSETVRLLQVIDRQLLRKDRFPKSHSLWLHLKQEYPIEFNATLAPEIVEFYQSDLDFSNSSTSSYDSEENSIWDVSGWSSTSSSSSTDENDSEPAFSVGNENDSDAASSVGNENDSEAASSVGNENDSEAASLVGNENDWEAASLVGNDDDWETASSSDESN